MKRRRGVQLKYLPDIWIFRPVLTSDGLFFECRGCGLWHARKDSVKHDAQCTFDRALKPTRRKAAK